MSNNYANAAKATKENGVTTRVNNNNNTVQKDRIVITGKKKPAVSPPSSPTAPPPLPLPSEKSHTPHALPQQHVTPPPPPKPPRDDLIKANRKKSLDGGVSHTTSVGVGGGGNTPTPTPTPTLTHTPPSSVAHKVSIKQLDSARQRLRVIQRNDQHERTPSSAFTIEAPEKKGVMWSKNGSSEWVQRWCVLKEGSLHIFESQKGNALGTIFLSGSVITDQPDSDEQNHFTVHTPEGRLWVFRAEEEYEYFTWIVSLRGATFYLRIVNPKLSAPAVQLARSASFPSCSPPSEITFKKITKLPKPIDTLLAPLLGNARLGTPSPSPSPSPSPQPFHTYTRPTDAPSSSNFFATHRRNSSPDAPVSQGGIKPKRGVLTVPEGKLFTSRKSRWVVLEGHSLFVFNSEEDEVNKEEAIHVLETIFINAKVVKSTQTKYIFEVVTTTKTIQFGASSGGELLAWISAIQEAQATLMSHYLQYDVLTADSSPTKGNTTEEQVTTDIDKSKQMLNSALKMAGNDVCADCGAPDILWASINIGVFLCINCCGVHRRMGVHISKVRSVTMDKWEKKIVKYMEGHGNTMVNAELEYNFPAKHAKITPNASASEREEYIRNKYEKKMFARSPT